MDKKKMDFQVWTIEKKPHIMGNLWLGRTGEKQEVQNKCMEDDTGDMFRNSLFMKLSHSVRQAVKVTVFTAVYSLATLWLTAVWQWDFCSMTFSVELQIYVLKICYSKQAITYEKEKAILLWEGFFIVLLDAQS